MHNFSRISFLFYILTSALVFQTAIGISPLFHICSNNNGNFSNNGDYQKSFNNLMNNLQMLAPAKGFALGSLGLNNLDRPYGLTLCRGDVSASDCRTCVAQASTELQKLCPYTKAAIIWYDNCLLRYSNNDFFGQIDNQNKLCLSNVNNVSDAVTFNEKTKELLGRLAVNASISRRMYAAGQVELEGSNKIYGLAQCSRDLLKDDCSKCLNGAIAEIPKCCDGKQGGRVVGASCTVHYEIYPFVNAY